jgi:hypothetical protein
MQKNWMFFGMKKLLLWHNTFVKEKNWTFHLKKVELLKKGVCAALESQIATIIE